MLILVVGSWVVGILAIVFRDPGTVTVLVGFGADSGVNTTGAFC